MKSEFRSELIVRVIERPGYFGLVNPLIYYSERLGREIFVPAGYETNFASIPRIFQSIIMVNSKHRKAATVHDYLCDFGRTEDIRQRVSDLIFHEAMDISDVNWIQKNSMFLFVRGYQATKDLFRKVF